MLPGDGVAEYHQVIKLLQVEKTDRFPLIIFAMPSSLMLQWYSGPVSVSPAPVSSYYPMGAEDEVLVHIVCIFADAAKDSRKTLDKSAAPHYHIKIFLYEVLQC
jgi:hypothetical protein